MSGGSGSGSGSGGFYKYRCNYFHTYKCPSWIYVSNSACANCLSEGRDSEGEPAPPRNNNSSSNRPAPKEIQAPYFDEHNVLQWALVEAYPDDRTGLYWEVHEKAGGPPPPPPPPQQQQQQQQVPGGMVAPAMGDPPAPAHAHAHAHAGSAASGWPSAQA